MLFLEWTDAGFMTQLRICIAEELSEISRVDNIFFTFFYVFINSPTKVRACGGTLLFEYFCFELPKVTPHCSLGCVELTNMVWIRKLMRARIVSSSLVYSVKSGCSIRMLIVPMA